MQPTLHSPRLTLRPFELSDANEVERLAGDFRVAETTAAIPHPYPKGGAIEWISTHKPKFEGQTGVIYAITDSETGDLLGAINLLDISVEDTRCEIGYWVAHSHWKRGICTEAARELINYAQSEFGITRVIARCLARNPASARVMEKLGLVQEGRLVKHVNHRGKYEDVLLYGSVLAGRTT